jgi:hypothetical protein
MHPHGGEDRFRARGEWERAGSKGQTRRKELWWIVKARKEMAMSENMRRMWFRTYQSRCVYCPCFNTDQADCDDCSDYEQEWTDVVAICAECQEKEQNDGVTWEAWEERYSSEYCVFCEKKC